MKIEQYRQRLFTIQTPVGSYAIIKEALEDEEVSKKEWTELSLLSSRASREYYRIEEEAKKTLTLKERYIRSIEESRSSEKILSIIRNMAADSNLGNEDIQEIQYQAIMSLKDMIVRY